MNKYQEDITLGKKSEDEVFELLKNKYDDLERTTGYSTFDYKTKNKKLKIGFLSAQFCVEWMF